MTRLIEFLIALGIVAVLALVVGLVLPSHRHISESVETNRKMTIAYDTVNNLRRFKDWNPLVLRDPKIQLNVTGAESGVGARLERRAMLESLAADKQGMDDTARALLEWLQAGVEFARQNREIADVDDARVIEVTSRERARQVEVRGQHREIGNVNQAIAIGVAGKHKEVECEIAGQAVSGRIGDRARGQFGAIVAIGQQGCRRKRRGICCQRI